MDVYSEKLTQTSACRHPFHGQNCTAGPLTPKHTALHVIRLDTVYTAKQHRYLKHSVAVVVNYVRWRYVLRKLKFTLQ